MKRKKLSLIVFSCIVWLAMNAANALSPGELVPVPIENITINDAFWAPRLSLWRTTTVNDLFTKFENDNTFTNFDLVAQGTTGTHYHDPWWDGLVYETIRAAADFMKKTPDSALKSRCDGYIARICAAAAKSGDGYLSTYNQTVLPGVRFDQGDARYNHDAYNFGCMVEAAVQYYKATGDTKLLAAACKYANYMCATFGAGKTNMVPSHELPEEALVRLYQLFKDDSSVKGKLSPLVINEDNYIALSRFWIENRGNHDNPARVNNANYTEYAQDHDYYYNQLVCKGHAVRGALFYLGIIANARVSGNTAYLAAAKTLWDNLVTRQMYVTGGVGATAADEAFGGDFTLPNNAYCETCAAVAAGFFSARMNLAFAESKYADALERELYNGALGGVGQNGASYYYTNTLKTDGEARWTWHGTPCCPPMFLKIMAEMPSYIYASNATSIYASLYVGSKAVVNMGGTAVTLTQVTNYPWEGTITVTVGLSAAKAFSLYFRIPGWSQGAAFAVNGASVTPVIVNGYAQINRTWSNGDAVKITFPMVATRVYMDPAVAPDFGRVALQRGPVIYCLEGMDNGNANFAMALPRSAALNSQSNAMLGGIYTITAQTPTGLLTAVPFYARANRTVGRTNVWIEEKLAAFDPNVNYKIYSRKYGKVLGCDAGRSGNGTYATYGDWQNADDQQWKLQDAGSGFLLIVNRKSGRVLGCEGANTAAGTLNTIWDWIGAADQYWTVTIGSQGYVKFVNRKVERAVAAVVSGTANRTCIKDQAASDEQDWTIVPVLDPNAEYKIINRGSGRAISCQGAGTANNTPVHLWDYLGGYADQVWYLRDQGNGYFKIVNKNSGRLLSCSGAGTANDADTILYDDVNAADQYWQVIAGDGGYLKIVNRLSGRALCCQAGGAINGTLVHIWDFLGGYDDQAWSVYLAASPIVPTPTSTVAPTSIPTGTNTPSPTPTSTPTGTNTPNSTLTPTATLEQTPTATRTTTGSPTATPTIKATPTPTSTPSPTPTPNSTIPAWAAYTAYMVGQKVTYNGVTYACRQSHTSLPGWEPPMCPLSG